MTIKYFLQSKKSPANIYIRIREGKQVDAKAKTNYNVNPEHFHNGGVKIVRLPANATVEIKKEIKKVNGELTELQSKLDSLKTRLSQSINQRNDFININSDWLKRQINPTNKNKLPSELVEFFDVYLDQKKNTIAHSTYKKIKSIKSRIEKYEKTNERIYIPYIDIPFSVKFQKWGQNIGYNPNTILKTLKVIKTVCFFASDLGVKTHVQLNSITKNLKYTKSEKIYLTFEEIDQIIKTPMKDPKLEIAKDWLIISCFTAQRVSDFLKFKKENLTETEGKAVLNIIQNKTGSPVSIPITKEVKDVLTKRNGEFPPIFSDNPDSNNTIYNQYIKEVCRLSGINKQVKAKFKNKDTKLFEEKLVPKHKAVSTHIGRRSFATNFYGLIRTPLLISITGHSSEKQFLEYVGKTEALNALTLADAMSNLERYKEKEPKLRVIKSASN